MLSNKIKKAKLVISEPWDFTELIKGALSAEVYLYQNNNSFIVKLNDEVLYLNKKIKYLVASPRYEKDLPLNLKEGEEVFCSLTLTTENIVKSSNPTDVSWWRGGYAFMGTIQLV